MSEFNKSLKYLSPSHQIAHYAFVIYVIYLTIIWMFFNFGGRGADPYVGTGFRWVLINAPLLILIAFHSLLLALKPSINKDPIIIFLLMYLIFTSMFSIIHLDLKYFSEVIRWVLPVIFIVHFKLQLDIRILNSLYIMTLLVVILTFNQVTDDYGYLPGQTSVNLHQGVSWRISIWKYITPPYSAAFSLIVFLANYFLNKNPSRFIMYAICTYFIILSGNRTSYLIFLAAITLLALFISKKNFKFNFFYSAIPIFSVMFVFALQIFADLIPLLGIQNDFFNSAILRNDSASGDASNLSSRLLIIVEQFRLMQNAGLKSIIGLGSDIFNSPGWSANGGFIGQSTDSYGTHLIARDGIASIFLFLSFASFFIESMKQRNIFGYIILLSLLLYTVGYGAWLNASSPVFLLFLGFIYNHNNFNDNYES